MTIQKSSSLSSSNYWWSLKLCSSIILIVAILQEQSLSTTAFSIIPQHSSCSLPSSYSLQQQQQQQQYRHTSSSVLTLSSSSSDDDGSASTPAPSPETFREAEILGLRMMQEGNHQEALKVFQKGVKLPGSRKDIIRTQRVGGPSPVGGSSGGTDGRIVQTLDEFELQAAHYNIACACARLGKSTESCQNLEIAFKNGFDNFDTVRADPDLSDVHGTPEFDNLMEKWNPKTGFFGFFK